MRSERPVRQMEEYVSQTLDHSMAGLGGDTAELGRQLPAALRNCQVGRVIAQAFPSRRLYDFHIALKCDGWFSNVMTWSHTGGEVL